MYVTILGKRWRLVFQPRVPALGGDGNDGICCPPTERGKRIVISSSLRGEHLLEILLHELLHAAFWWLDEEYVVQVSRDFAKILARLKVIDQDFSPPKRGRPPAADKPQ